MGTTNNLFDMSPEQSQNLTNFGFAMMANAAKPGATTLGAAGQAGLDMNQAALQKAQTGYIGAEAQNKQLMNQMIPYQLQLAKLNAAMAQKDYNEEYPDARQQQPQATIPSGASAGMPFSQTPGTSRPQSIAQRRAGGNLSQMEATGSNIFPTGQPDNVSQVANLNDIVNAVPQSSVNAQNLQQPATAQVQTGPNADEQAQLNNLARKARLQKRIGGDASPYEAQAQRINNTILERDKVNMTYQKTPQGQFVLPGQELPSTSSAPIPLTPEQTAKYVSGDGKSIIPFVSSARYAPDPSGMPKYPDAKTETDVNQTKIFQDSDNKANAAITTSASSLQNEQFRLKELAAVYKQVQAGTLTAQNPELINKLVAWGVIKDPSEIKNLAGVQNAMQSHILQIIQQIKDTNANMGGAPTRTFGSEISNLMEKGENAGAQPEALWNIIGQAQGIVSHHLDMVKGWDDIGGLGNRLANGNTLRPEDYARKFIGQHDISDYKAAAQKDMGPFKGMASEVNPQQASANYNNPAAIKKAFKEGKLPRDQAIKMLHENHGMIP